MVSKDTLTSLFSLILLWLVFTTILDFNSKLGSIYRLFSQAKKKDIANKFK